MPAASARAHHCHTHQSHSCSRPVAPNQPKRLRRATRSADVLRSADAIVAQSGVPSWQDVDQPLLWRGDEEAALAAGSPASNLPAPWKMMLLSDGSVTRHLQLLTGQPIRVECLSMDVLSLSEQQQPPPQQQQQQQQQPHQQQQPPQHALQIPGPLVQRQVLLWSQSQPRVPLVYAASWWASASVDKYLADKSLPIWVSLSQGHLELYREIQTVAVGDSLELERLFGCKGPFWSRQYFFWHDGAPLTLIHEVFSNSLEAHLGPLGGSGGQ